MTAVVTLREIDRATFSNLLRKHDGQMRGLAFKLLGGDRDRMDDVLQDAYLKAFRSLSSFRADADFATWLYRIVHNACIDELRRSRPLVPFDDVDHGASPSPERQVATADAVQRALNALPIDQRSAVILVDGEGFDLRGAAEVLGVPTGTVASRVSRARSALRIALGGDLHD